MGRRQVLVAAAIAWVASSPGNAAQAVSTTFTVLPPIEVAPVARYVLNLAPAAAEKAATVPSRLVFTCSLTCSATADLSPGSWLITAPLPGPVWIRPTPLISVGNERAPRVDLGQLTPTAVVTWSLGSAEPTLRAAFRLAGAGPLGFTYESACERANDEWTCWFPAIPIDVRLEAKGYVPAYRWNFTPPSTREALSLVRGASVAAWLTGLAPNAPVSASLISLDNPKQPSRPFRFAGVGRDAALISLGPVEPGRYEASISQPGKIKTNYRVWRVMPGEASELPQPISLDQPSATLEVAVLPATSRAGAPWTLQLLYVDEASRVADEVGRWPFDEFGSFVGSGLAPGRYQVVVLDSRGGRKIEDLRDLNPGTQKIVFSVNEDAVSGVVYLGDKPLANARVSFRRGSRTETLEADPQGRFTGDLDRGTWDVRVLAREPKVERRLKVDVEPGHELELRVADLAVGGRVERADGNPGDAVVTFTILAKDDQGSSSTRTNDEGKFELHGLGPGKYTVTASSRDDRESSDEVSVTVDAKTGGPRDLVIRLRQKATLRGRILGNEGTLTSAAVEVRGLQNPVWGVVETARADADGVFEIGFPAGNFPVLITVFAAGYPVIAKAVATSGENVDFVLPVVAGTISITDRFGSTGTGDRRQLIAIQGGLPFIEGPSGGVTQRTRPDGSIELDLRVSPGPIEACSGTALELHQFLVAARKSGTLTCSKGVVIPGGMLKVVLNGAPSR